MKDEQLLKDGFKKFLKTEPCRVEGCRFTMICNHIHCVRSNCTYVLHSSGQLLSHKRKHERMDAEMAYRRFKMGQTAKDLTPSELAALQSFHGLDLTPKPPPPPTVNQFPVADQATTERFNKLLNNATMENLNALLSHTAANTSNVTPELLKEIQEQQMRSRRSNGRESPKHETDENGEGLEDTIPKSVIQNVQNEEMKSPTVEEVEQIISQYFTDQCSKQQQNSNEPLDLNVKTSNKPLLECFMSNNESHLHCLITGCEAVVPRSLKDISEHLRMHELNRGADSIIQNSNLLQITSIEGFFNRKRGRPPKNRVVEVYNNVSWGFFGP
jgi:DNA-binding protein Fis